MPRIRDPRRAARPSEMQRSRIPLSSPMSVCICGMRTNGARSMCTSMSMESMEWGRELEGGAVGVVVDVGVGDLTEVVPVTRAGLLAPAAQA